MGLVRYAQTAFTSGEWSERMKGQTQMQQYYAAVDTMSNCEVLPQGPFDKRAGFEYLGEANVDTEGTTRLIEFVANESDAIIVEIDTTNISFWKDGAQIGGPYQLTSWVSTVDELFEMNYEQEGNSIYFTHPNWYPRRLTRNADADWTLGEVPLVTEPFQEDFRTPATTLTLSATTGTAVTATAGSSQFLQGDVYRFIRAGTGYGVITGYTSGTVVTISVLSDFDSTSIASGDWELFGGSFDATLTFSAIPGDPIYGRTATLTASNASFRSDDVGKYIGIAGGVVRIETFTSSTVVDVILVTSLDNKTATEQWTLYKQAWQTAGDYPSALSFHDGRLFFAGASATSINRNKVYGSRPNDYTRFDIGADDDDGLSATLGGKANQIRWMASARELVIGTVGDERTLFGADGALTPSTLQSRVGTRWGSAQVKPTVVNNEVLFVQRSKESLRNSLFSFQEDSYNSVELSFYAEHIAASKVKEMALQEDPRTVVWMALEDGRMAGMSYKPDQGVLAWHIHNTVTDATEKYASVIESVAVIPGTNGDEVWAAVRRQTGASTYQKTIERLNSDERSAYLDSWTKVTNGSPSTSVTGLPSWMNGLEVSVLVDGATHPNKTVSSGSITLDLEGTTIYVGFPYTGKMVMLEPEGGIGNGNSQGISKRVARSMIRVEDTGSFSVNGQVIPFRDATMQMDVAPNRRTGDVKSDSGTAWDEKGGYTIESDLPLPLTVIMIAFHYEANLKQ